MDDDLLHITLVQPDMVWADASKNREKYGRMWKELRGHTDLILLPEMFTTGFCTDPVLLAEPMDGETVRWMCESASALQASLAGSLIVAENGLYYNRLVFADPGGRISYYDKRHLFRMAGEEVRFTAGSVTLIVKIGRWRISFLICYDLRFPVWSRNRKDYDLLVYASNWPAARRDVWNTLLRARAIENQCFVAGVNRVGTDGEGIHYVGESLVIDPKGKVMASGAKEEEQLIQATLSLRELEAFRQKFPVWKDWENFKLD